MFKFVVLCALIGAAVSEPEPGVISYSAGYYPGAYSNIAYSSPLLQPGYSAISPLATSYAATIPTVYSGAHLIKKRSADPGLLSYSAGYYPSAYSNIAYSSGYSAISPLATTYAATIPTTFSSPLLTTGAHFIKKRSAALAVPTTYLAPTAYAAGAPLYTSTLGAASYYSSPYVSSLPLAYTGPFIKK